MLKKILNFSAVGLAIVISFLVLADLWQNYNQNKNLAEDEILKTSKDKIVEYRFEQDENGNNIVAYYYASEKVVPQASYQGFEEDMEKRTARSQSFVKEIIPIDEETQEERYVAKFFSGVTFAQEGDNWYEVDVATTTPQAFAAQTRLTMIDKVKNLFGQEVFAATDTTYSGAGDGAVLYSATESDPDDTWDIVHDATVGTSASYTAATMVIGGGNGIGSSGHFMYRSFLPFDTSALPDTANISSATLYIMPYLIVNSADDGNDFVTVVQTTQASNTSLVTADYDNCGAVNNPTEGIDAGSRVDFGSMTTDVYSSLALNSTGRSWISLTGYTNLGLREGHDALDDNFVGVSTFIINDFGIYMSEQSGTASDPYLEVTYSTIGTINVQLKAGTMKFKGGTLKLK